MEGVDNIVYGVATGVCDGKISIETPEGNIEELLFDYLVCATGFHIPTFTPEPGQDPIARRKEVEKMAQVLSDPEKHVVVAGGGAVGVEIAGDILDGGNRNLTLVTAGDRLLLNQPEKYSKKALDQLESRGVKVMFGERVVSHSETTVAEPGKKLMLMTSYQETIECDAYLPAYARGPRTEWLTKAVGDAQLPFDLLDDKSLVRVDEYLASTVYPKLYVVGACNSIAEPPVMANMDSQAQCIAKNIVNDKSAKYGGGMLKSEMFQPIGHKSHAFFVPEAFNCPICVSQCLCFVCGFPLNMLCPCVWCGIAFGPCTPFMCGYCCSAAEGKGVVGFFEKSAKIGFAADSAGFNGVAFVAPQAQEMQRT